LEAFILIIPGKILVHAVLHLSADIGDIID